MGKTQSQSLCDTRIRVKYVLLMGVGLVALLGATSWKFHSTRAKVLESDVISETLSAECEAALQDLDNTFSVEGKHREKVDGKADCSPPQTTCTVGVECGGLQKTV